MGSEYIADVGDAERPVARRTDARLDDAPFLQRSSGIYPPLTKKHWPVNHSLVEKRVSLIAEFLL
jgi:hypothetical protein